MPKMRAFLSYSRRDGAFVRILHGHLVANSVEAAMDVTDLLPGDAWEARLEGLITEADVLVFIVSPSSVRSKNCLWELERARTLGKKIIPLIWRRVPRQAMPPALDRFNYVRFDDIKSKDLHDNDAFAGPFRSLTVALHLADAIWSRELSPWTRRAAEWSQAAPEFKEDLLPRAGEVALLQRVLNDRPTTMPPIPEIIFAYLTESLRKADDERRAIEAREQKIAWHCQALIAKSAREAMAAGQWQSAIRICLAGMQDAGSWSRGVRQNPVLAATLAAATHGSPLIDARPSQEGPIEEEYIGCDSFNIDANGGHSYYVPASASGVSRRSFAARSRHLHNSIYARSNDDSSIEATGRIGGLPVSLKIENVAVIGLLLSPDGRTLLALTPACRLLTWDVSTGRAIAVEPDGREVGFHAALALSNDHGVAATPTGAFYLWRRNEPGNPITLKGHSSGPLVAVFSSSGSLLASGSRDGTVRLWSIPDGRQQYVAQFQSGVTEVKFSPGDHLFAVGRTGAISLHHAETGVVATEFHTERDDYITAFYFSIDARRLLSFGGDVREWALPGSQSFKLLTSFESSLRKSANRRGDYVLARIVRNVVCLDVSGTVYFHQIVPGCTLRDLGISDDGRRVFFSIFRLSNESYQAFLVSTDENDVREVVLRSGAEIRKAAFDPATSSVYAADAEGGLFDAWAEPAGASFGLLCPSEIACIEVRGDLPGIAIGCASGEVLFHQLGKTTTIANVGDASVSAVRWAGDRAIVVVAEQAYLFDPSAGRLVAPLQPHGTALQSASFSKGGGTRLEGRKKLYETALSRAGDMAATAGGDGVVKIFRALDGIVAANCIGHTNAVVGLDFSPCGRRLLSWGRDDRLMVWCTASGQCIASFSYEDAEMGYACWVEDDALLFITSKGMAHFLDATWLVGRNDGELVAAGIARLLGADRLTRDERDLLEPLVATLSDPLVDGDATTRSSLPPEHLDRWRSRRRVTYGGLSVEQRRCDVTPDPALLCNFCGSARTCVPRLIVSGESSICSDCVSYGRQQLTAFRAKTAGNYRVMDLTSFAFACNFCGEDKHAVEAVAFGGNIAICNNCLVRAERETIWALKIASLRKRAANSNEP